MADDPVDGPADQAPNFLTVHQTADVLQLGRSTTYELVGLFVESNGAAGIPAVMCGGQYRIPRGRLEAWNGGPISWPPTKRKRTRRSKRATEDIQAGPADTSTVERSGDAGPTDDADAPPLTGECSDAGQTDEAVEHLVAPADVDIAGDEVLGTTLASGLNGRAALPHDSATLGQPSLPFEG